MFYRTQIKSVGSGYAVDVFGKHLYFIGYYPCKAGDIVWTDGRVIFGNISVKPTPITFNESAGVPVLADNLRGYFTKNASFKEYGVIQADGDTYLVNNSNHFLHGNFDSDYVNPCFVDVSAEGKLLYVDGKNPYKIIAGKEIIDTVDDDYIKNLFPKKELPVFGGLVDGKTISGVWDTEISANLVAVTFFPDSTFKMLFSVIAYSEVSIEISPSHIRTTRVRFVFIDGASDNWMNNANWKRLVENPNFRGYESYRTDDATIVNVVYMFVPAQFENRTIASGKHFVIYDSVHGAYLCGDSFYFPLQNDFFVHISVQDRADEVDGVFFGDLDDIKSAEEVKIPDDIEKIGVLDNLKKLRLARFNQGSYLLGFVSGKLYKLTNGKAELLADNLRNGTLRQLKNISKARR